MVTLRSTILAMIVALLATAVLAGCTSTGIPQDGRYQTHGGGWDNFRA
jgi:predicted small secreted protein